MKRLGVAGIIQSGGSHSLHLLLGRRGKELNKGMFVLPGGGVKDGETLEQAFCREVMEETGLELKEDSPHYSRWYHPFVIELEDRIIFVARATVKCKDKFDDTPRDGSDLYDVNWFRQYELPHDISPVVVPVLASCGFVPGKRK